MNRVVLAIALLLSFGVVGAGWIILDRWDSGVDVSRVAIRGELDARQLDQVAQVLRDNSNHSDGIDGVRQRVADLDWIHDARVSRQWPDGVVIEILKEVPIAWWNDDAFINAEGRVFTSPYVDLANLPQLYGPGGTERVVMQQFQMLAKAVARVDQTIDTLRLDDRGAWQFETGEGITVMLGKDNIMDRIQRFLLVVERVGLAERMDDIRQIDVRYPNGLAVSWADVPPGLAIADSYKKPHPEITKRETRL